MQHNHFASNRYQLIDILEIITKLDVNDINEFLSSFTTIERKDTLNPILAIKKIVTTINNYIQDARSYNEISIEEITTKIVKLLSSHFSFENLLALLKEISSLKVNCLMDKQNKDYFILQCAIQFSSLVTNGDKLTMLLDYLNKSERSLFIKHQNEYWHQETVRQCQMTVLSIFNIFSKSNANSYYKHGICKEIKHNILKLADLSPSMQSLNERSVKMKLK